MAPSTMPSSTSTWARAAISGTTPPNLACSSVCERTISDRIRPDPSLRRSTTAAAVSSQVVSIPSTSIDVSLPNLSPCAIGQSGVSVSPGSTAGSRSAIVRCPKSGSKRIRRMAVLVTRPHPDDEATAAILRSRGFEVLLAPVLRFEPVAFHDDLDARYGAVIVTSANALRGIELKGHRLLELPLFAVGEHTASAARHAGFTHVMAGSGDAVGLRDLVL